LGGGGGVGGCWGGVGPDGGNVSRGAVVMSQRNQRRGGSGVSAGGRVKAEPIERIAREIQDPIGR